MNNYLRVFVNELLKTIAGNKVGKRWRFVFKFVCFWFKADFDGEFSFAFSDL